MKELLEGMLHAIGGIIGFVLVIFLLVLALRVIKGKRTRNATVGAWKEYLKDILKEEKFAEAAALAKLLVDKNDADELPTPKGYEVKVDRDLVIDEADETRSRIRWDKKFVIKKKN